MFWTRDKCKKLINYDATNISLSGFEGPNQINFKVGSFQIKRDVLQAAIDIAQMYDMFQYSNCQRIQQFSAESPERDRFVLEIHKNEERLLEFLAMLRVAAARPSEKIEQALSDWVAFTFTKGITQEAPIIPEKVRAGELVRESPPIEEYNEIKRSVAKARLSSPYLKDALGNPTFDINKVYG